MLQRQWPETLGTDPWARTRRRRRGKSMPRGRGQLLEKLILADGLCGIGALQQDSLDEIN